MKLMIQKIVSPHFIKSEVTQNIQTANKYSIVPLGTALPHIIYSTMNNWDFLKGSLTVLHPAVHTKSDGSSCVENKNMEFERGVQTLQTFTLQRTCPITGWVQMLLRLSAKHFIKSILRLFVLNYTCPKCLDVSLCPDKIQMQFKTISFRFICIFVGFSRLRANQGRPPIVLMQNYL